MISLNSKVLKKTIEVGRLIGKIRQNPEGPTVIFTGGIHGNEPSGVFALHHVMQYLEKNKPSLKGNVYAISGNLWALEKGKRFHKQDLNRLWTTEKTKKLYNNTLQPSNEDEVQQLELYNIIRNILNSEKGPFYFIDLHTTSSETIPFLTVNDSLLNRKFTQLYPVPMILGIEEYLDGPLLSHVNELGYVAFGFEAGQHDDQKSIENHESMIFLSLVYAGILERNKANYKYHYNSLYNQCKETNGIYEIYFRYQIQPNEKFVMKPGYKNFEFVHKGKKLAESNGKEILADRNSRVFMPLYQSQGEDGFFGIKEVNPIFLKLSVVIRKIGLDRFIALLPGVKWTNKSKSELIVNRSIAKLFAKQIFHLMGYRSKKIDQTHLRMKNREAASREKEYQNENWYKPF